MFISYQQKINELTVGTFFVIAITINLKKER
ncbi:UNVERIFIED_ORG: hypothetical protein OKW14_000786 [Pantoea brenneri]|nr:hypothetical protein [Pantoea brenneri]